jgi:hypothetical protein
MAKMMVANGLRMSMVATALVLVAALCLTFISTPASGAPISSTSDSLSSQTHGQSYLRLKTIKCFETESFSGPDRVYITANGSRYWGEVDMNNGDLRDLSSVADIPIPSNGLTLQVWDADWPDADDWLGSNTIYSNSTSPNTAVFNQDGAYYEVTYEIKKHDSEAPSVTLTSPTGKRVAPGANVTATFSEDMLPSSINTGTFTLTKSGSSTPVAAVVTYDSATKKATLNPSSKLKKGATYTARVTTGVQDLAGHSLGSDKVWTFKVRP